MCGCRPLTKAGKLATEQRLSMELSVFCVVFDLWWCAHMQGDMYVHGILRTLPDFMLCHLLPPVVCDSVPLQEELMFVGGKVPCLPTAWLVLHRLLH